MEYITNLLRELKKEDNGIFEALYKEYFPTVKKFVVNNSGNLLDAEDIFQDTMIVFLQKLRSDNFELTASVKTYIVAIAKHLWLKKLRDHAFKNIAYTEIFDEQFADEINLSIEHEKAYAEKLKLYITKVTKHCQQLIHDIYFQYKSIQQIKEDYGYSSIHNAQNQKHKCIEQIRDVKSNQERNNN